MELNQTQWNQLRLNRMLAEHNGGELGLKMHDAAAVSEAQERARLAAHTPAQHSTPGGPVSAAQPAEPERRLADLRALGGTVKYKDGSFKFTQIVKLVAQEQAADRTRRDPKTIRSDLKEAAQAERDAKAAGFASGLGQR
jgi:hypothetical protein